MPRGARGDQIQRTVYILAGTLLDKPELPGLISTHHPKSAWSGCPGATEGLKRWFSTMLQGLEP